MRRTAVHIMGALCLVMLSFTWKVKQDSYTGYAYLQGTDKLVYTERFTDYYEGDNLVETRTDYFDPEKKLIASRTLNFSHSKFSPAFSIEDFRSGYLEGAELRGKALTLFVRKDSNSKTEKKIIRIPGECVIDGGFNQFIKANWDDLMNGKAISFYFTVPARLDYYKLRIVKHKSSDGTIVLKISPDNSLLRWLADPILVSYDIATKRITQYEGKSNIAGTDGITFDTKLVYPDKGP